MSRGGRFDTLKLDLFELADVLSSAFDSRILHQKGATCERGRVLKFIHVVNNDTSTHAVHSCTVAFSTQSRSSAVSVLILTDCAHSVNGSRNNIHVM